MTLASLLSDMTIFAVFYLIGVLLVQLIKPLQKLFMPAAIVGGLVALLVGQQVLKLVEIPSSFSGMSSVLINIIPCCAVFGTSINRSKIRNYGDFLCVYLVTYGVQMAVSAIVGALCERVWPELPHGWGIMALFSFWGGHGTAATAGGVFEQLGIEGNVQMGMILSTIGLIVAMVGGMVVVNWGIRKGYAQKVTTADSESISGVVAEEKRESLGAGRISPICVSNLMFQLALVLFCIFFGKYLLKGVALVIPSVAKLPGMINGILGALILWPVMCVLKISDYVDRKTVSTIAGVCLDMVMLSAVATLDLKLFAEFIAPIVTMTVVICGGTVIWSIFYTKWICKEDWFEKAVGSFGQSNGSVPTGLALIRCVDPNTETSAAETMGVANSVTSPLYSTMSAIGPMILVSSLAAFVGIGALIFFVPLIASYFLFVKHK